MTMGKEENKSIYEYRDPHLLPYSFAKTNGILIGEDDNGYTLCMAPDANREMIPEVMRVFGSIEEVKKLYGAGIWQSAFCHIFQ